ncbi:MAG: isoleucine--tRNA ligase [Patescibacteria group bacterium]|nr:isoleucine--tRNA ligase [Patescibacteria group bacterium]MDD5490969.1 isoleucine--tRNA ligase [Patescibacteria group bacterium]
MSEGKIKKSFPEIEEEILKFWEENKTFEKSVAQRDEKNLYVFYDGPPFATGLPHYGHIVAGTMKDVVPRYWTMRGKRVERRWGWDCHGLPIENIVEKELNLKSRKDIEALGVAKFNEACRSKVLMYADEWKKIVKRLGRWVDMENDYKTMDVSFMESVWWVFKSLWEKGLVYEGYKSMHICPRCETTLSNIEVSDGYKDISDISVIVKFKLVGEKNVYALAWTTTPWTLPGNVALAVGADIDYAKVKIGGEFYILATELLEEVLNGKKYEVTERMKGKDLENKKYEPLFPFFLDKDLPHKDNLYKIVTAGFVSTDDGTGIVHIAPAFGEDDMNLGREKNLSFIQHVKTDGRFTDDITPWAGREVKPKVDPTGTDALVVEYLAKAGLLFSQQRYEHSYPHCWRCESPLLNYAASSWFIKVTAVEEEMLKLAKEINWVPAHLKEGRFGQWLESTKDWSISRSRYWGNPMPVWRCDSCKKIRVIGSKEELEKLSQKKVSDIHKHFIDEITFKCEKCSGQMRRIPEVFDCWVESGSMPYGQMHYPFENKKKFEENFPAEFIGEGVDQTRGWFYTLHVLSTALFARPAYKNVIANGIVLAEDGQKMSKSKNNYPDPMALVNKYGADALRYYLTTSAVMKAEDLCFSEKQVDEVYKKVILILENVLSFYEMYKEKKIKEVKSRHILDRWVLSKVNELVRDVTVAMEAYDLPAAAKPIAEFINELSTWYIRRSRDRFKSADSEDKKAALSTLDTILKKLALVAAPFTPFLAEEIWRKVGNKESVHLEKWPESGEILPEVLEQMGKVKKIVEEVLAGRDEVGIKIRQPLAELVIAEKIGEEYLEILKDEVNVKTVKMVAKDELPKGEKWLEKAGIFSLNLEISEELKKEGLIRDLTRQVNALRKKAGLTIKDQVDIFYETVDELIMGAIADHEEKLKNDTLSRAIKPGKGDFDAEAELELNGAKFWLGIKKFN